MRRDCSGSGEARRRSVRKRSSSPSTRVGRGRRARRGYGRCRRGEAEMTQVSAPPDFSAVLARRNCSINGYSCTGVNFVQRCLGKLRRGQERRVRWNGDGLAGSQGDRARSACSSDRLEPPEPLVNPVPTGESLAHQIFLSTLTGRQVLENGAVASVRLNRFPSNAIPSGRNSFRRRRL
jgi:hypothetical protein